MIKVGDTLPHTTLMEYSEVEGEGCSIGPNAIDVAKASAGKTIALFALPGAFTPTCSLKHLPGFIEKSDELRAKGVDAIACVSVTDYKRCTQETTCRFRRLLLTARNLVANLMDRTTLADVMKSPVVSPDELRKIQGIDGEGI